MRLSLRNETLLKNAMSASDKEHEMQNITKEIEGLEHQIGGQINTGYVDIIKKCMVLDELKGHLKEIIVTNKELRREADDLLVRHSAIEKEVQTLKKAEARLLDIRKAFSLIVEFIEAVLLFDSHKEKMMMRSSSSPRESDEIFCVEQALRKMKEKKVGLKQYTFYRSILVAHKKRYEEFSEFIREEMRRWVETIDLKGPGKIVDFGSVAKIFDPVVVYRRHVLTTEFYKLVYASKRIGIEHSILKIIDEGIEDKILSLKRDSSKAADLLTAVISLLLLNGYLCEVFSLFLSKREEILGLLDYAKPLSMFEIVRFKKSVVALRIESEKIDSFIEKISFRYFEDGLTKGEERNDENRKFFEVINDFIGEATTYLNRLGSQETDLEELLAQRLDHVLVSRLKSLGDDREDEGAKRLADFVDRTEKTLSLLLTRVPAAAGMRFHVREEMEKINEEIIEAKYEKLAEDIRGSSRARELVELLISLKAFMTENVRNELAKRLSKNCEELMKGKDKEDIELFLTTIEKNFDIHKSSGQR